MAESTKRVTRTLDAMHNGEPGVWLAHGFEPDGWHPEDKGDFVNFGVAFTREGAQALADERIKNLRVEATGEWKVSAFQLGGRNSLSREVTWSLPFGKTRVCWQQVEFEVLKEE